MVVVAIPIIMAASMIMTTADNPTTKIEAMSILRMFLIALILNQKSPPEPLGRAGSWLLALRN